MAPFSRSPVTSVSRTLEALVEMVGLLGPLLRSRFVPGRLVAFPDYINVPLTSANFPVTVLRVSFYHPASKIT